MNLKDRLKALYPANDMITDPFQFLPTWEKWANEELYENRDGVVIRSGLYLRDRKYITSGFLDNKKSIEDETINRLNADNDLNNRLKVVEQNQGGTTTVVSADAGNNITSGTDSGAYLKLGVASADQPTETNVAIASFDTHGNPTIIGGLEFSKADFVVADDPNAANFVTIQAVKKAPTIRRAPTGYTLDRTTTPWTVWFDNGSSIQFPSYPATATVYGYGFVPNSTDLQNPQPYPLPSDIIRTSQGTISIDNWSKKEKVATFWGDDTIVGNPINDSSKFDFTNAKYNPTDTDTLAGRQKNVIRVMYELGIWSESDITALGAVRK